MFFSYIAGLALVIASFIGFSYTEDPNPICELNTDQAKAGMQFGTFDKTKACIQTARMNKDILDKQHNAFQTLMEIYAFDNTINDSFYPNIPYNTILTEETGLYKQIVLQLESSGKSDFQAYEYEDKVANMVQNLRDGHVSYFATYDFYSRFIFYFPVFFAENSETGDVTIAATLPNQFYNSVYENTDLEALIYKKKLKKINDEIPSDFIRKYAYAIYNHKSRHSTYNNLASPLVAVYASFPIAILETYKEFRLEFSDETMETVYMIGSYQGNERITDLAQFYYSLHGVNTQNSGKALLSQEIPETEQTIRFRKCIEEAEVKSSCFGIKDPSLIVTKEQLLLKESPSTPGTLKDNNEITSAIDDETLLETLYDDKITILSRIKTDHPNIKALLGMRSENMIRSEGENPAMFLLQILEFSDKTISLDKEKNNSPLSAMFNYMKANEAKYLFISVIGNPGGSIHVPPAIVDAIYSNVFPRMGDYTVNKEAKLNKLIFKLNQELGGNYTTDKYTGKELDYDYLFKTDTGINNDKQTNFFSLNEEGYKFSAPITPLNLQRDHVILLTDLLCASSATVLSKQLIEKRLAIAIGLGGDPKHLDNSKFTGGKASGLNIEPVDVGLVAGGVVTDSDSIKMIIEEFKKAPSGYTQEYWDNKIKEILSSDADLKILLDNYQGFSGKTYLSVTQYRIYSEKYNYGGALDGFSSVEERKFKPLEFYPVEFHERIPYTPKITDAIINSFELVVGLYTTNEGLKTKASHLKSNLIKSYFPKGTTELCKNSYAAMCGSSFEDPPKNLFVECGYYNYYPFYVSESPRNNNLNAESYKLCNRRSDAFTYINLVNDYITEIVTNYNGLVKSLGETNDKLSKEKNGFLWAMVAVIVILLVVLAVMIYFIVLSSKKKRVNLSIDQQIKI